jgi:hypothetical protein
MRGGIGRLDTEVSTVAAEADADTLTRGRGTAMVVREVRLPPGATGDYAAKRAAIAEHRRRAGWMEPVVLVSPVLTQSEWLARYGLSESEP